MERKKVDPRTLRIGPKRRDRLPKYMMAQVRKVYATVGHLGGCTLQEFVDDLCRDAYPAKEVGVWELIATTWDRWMHENGGDETDVFNRILSITLGCEDKDEMDARLRLMAEGIKRSGVGCSN